MTDLNLKPCPPNNAEELSKKPQNHDFYTYRVQWSEKDQEFVGLCIEFPGLSFLGEDRQKAFLGIQDVVSELVDDLKAKGSPVPKSNYLKPCPFCGGNDLELTKTKIRCCDCKCVKVGVQGEEELVRAWNTRSDPCPARAKPKQKPQLYHISAIHPMGHCDATFRLTEGNCWSGEAVEKIRVDIAECYNLDREGLVILSINHLGDAEESSQETLGAIKETREGKGDRYKTTKELYEDLGVE